MQQGKSKNPVHMRKIIMFFLVSILLFLTINPVNASASEDLSTFKLPKPRTPNYFLFEQGDDDEYAHAFMKMFYILDRDVAALGYEYYHDPNTFCEKYELYSFNLVMQYDVSLDNESSWQYTKDWDKECYIGSYTDGYQSISINDVLVSDFEFFWLTYYEGYEDNFVPYQPAIYAKHHSSENDEWDTYHFDTNNHSLYIRCRYYMEWEPYINEEIQEKKVNIGEWSDSAIFGKDSTQVDLKAPEVYEAPKIADLRIMTNSEDIVDGITYYLDTPNSVWETDIYYLMTQDGEFEGLQSQISVNDAEWCDYYTANSGGDWALSNGERIASGVEPKFEPNSHVKLRVRFTGTHGPSDWSNVIEINGGSEESAIETEKDTNINNKDTNLNNKDTNLNNEETNIKTEDTKPVSQKISSVEDKEEKCSLCGICPIQPLGLCLFIWIGIAIVLLIVIVLIFARKKDKVPR